MSVAVAPISAITPESTKEAILLRVEGKTEEERLSVVKEFLDQTTRVQEQADKMSWAIIDALPLAIPSMAPDEALKILDPTEHHRKRADYHTRTLKTKEKHMAEIKARWGDDLSTLTDRIPKAGEPMGRHLTELARLTGREREDGDKLRRRALNSALVHRMVSFTSRREPEFNNNDFRKSVIYARQMIGLPVPEKERLNYVKFTADECRRFELTIEDGLLTPLKRAKKTDAIEVDEGNDELQMVGRNEVLLIAKDFNKEKEGEGGALSTPKDKSKKKDKGKGKAKTEPVNSTKKTAISRNGKEKEKGKGKEKEVIDAEPVIEPETELEPDPDPENVNVIGALARTTQAGPSGNCPNCRFPAGANTTRSREYPEEVEEFMKGVIEMCGNLFGICRTCGRQISFTNDTIVLLPGLPKRTMPIQGSPTQGKEKRRKVTPDRRIYNPPRVVTRPPPKTTKTVSQDDEVEDVVAIAAAALSTETPLQQGTAQPPSLTEKAVSPDDPTQSSEEPSDNLILRPIEVVSLTQLDEVGLPYDLGTLTSQNVSTAPTQEKPHHVTAKPSPEGSQDSPTMQLMQEAVQPQSRNSSETLQDCIKPPNRKPLGKSEFGKRRVALVPQSQSEDTPPKRKEGKKKKTPTAPTRYSRRISQRPDQISLGKSP